MGPGRGVMAPATIAITAPTMAADTIAGTGTGQTATAVTIATTAAAVTIGGIGGGTDPRFRRGLRRADPARRRAENPDSKKPDSA